MGSGISKPAASTNEKTEMTASAAPANAPTTALANAPTTALATAPTTALATAVVPTPDYIGVASFFDFICAALSRIAYTEDPISYYLVKGLFKIIPLRVKQAISKLKSTEELKNFDEELKFGLNDQSNVIPFRITNGKKSIDFTKYAKDVNELIENTENSPFFTHDLDPKTLIISVADSNYGDVLIIGHLDLTNFVFVCYRGTYSAKTAGSYTKPQTLFPYIVNETKQTGVLKGIEKITLEIMHTISNAMAYVVNEFLKPTDTEKVIPVFTGHSLGGGMATLMVYEYASRKKEDFGGPEYSKLSDNAVCISFGSPRVLNEKASEDLCRYVIGNSIILHRFSNTGDPITALPPMGFFHPCSSKNDKKAGYRQHVSRECGSAIQSRPVPTAVYNKNIKCTTVEPTSFDKLKSGSVIITDHMNYLFVSFIKAADVVHLFLGSALTFGTTEVARVKEDNPTLQITSGDTQLRFVLMDGRGTTGKFLVDFVDLKKLTINTDKGLMEDKKVTYEMFKTLITESNAITTVKFVEKPTPSSGKKLTPLPAPFTKTPTFETLEDNEKNYQALLAGHTIEKGELVKPAEPVTTTSDEPVETTTSDEPVKTLDDNKLTSSVSPALDDKLNSTNTIGDLTKATPAMPLTTNMATAAAGGSKKSRKKTNTKNKKRRKTRKRRKTKKRRNILLK
jgi:hypothetical protein